MWYICITDANDTEIELSRTEKPPYDSMWISRPIKASQSKQVLRMLNMYYEMSAVGQGDRLNKLRIPRRYELESLIKRLERFIDQVCMLFPGFEEH